MECTQATDKIPIGLRCATINPSKTRYEPVTGSVSLALPYPHLRSWLPLREHLDVLYNLLEEEIRCRLGGGVNAQVIELLAYIPARLNARPRVHRQVLHGDIGLLREIH